MMIAFVDYENIGSLKEVNLSLYEKIIIFRGQQQDKLSLGETPPGEGSQFRVVKVTGQSRNNLDFHLAFELGRSHQTEPEAVGFHLISNDKGFDNLLAHLKALSRKCKRIEVAKKGESVASTGSNKSSHHCPVTEQVIKKLRGISEKKRPSKKTRLVNWIKNQNRSVESPETLSSIIDNLVDKKILRLEGDQISYIH